MFIKIFRTESILQFVILLFLGFLLWLPAFIHPLPTPQPWSPVPVYEHIIAILGHSSLLTTITAFFLVLVQGILLTLLLTAHDLSIRNNAFPAIIYMIFMSWNPQMLTLHPALLANLMLLAFLNLFLKIYEKPDAFTQVFSACLILSLTCMLDTPVALLMILVWFGFLIYRIFTWREWIISLIGFSLPFIYILFYYFWVDRLPEFFSHCLNMSKNIHYVNFHVDVVTLILLITMGLIAFSAVLRIYRVMQEKVISIRKKFIFIIWFFLLAIFIFAFSGQSRWFQGTISLLPATALVSYHLSTLKKLFWWEILFTILLLGLLWIRIF